MATSVKSLTHLLLGVGLTLLAWPSPGHAEILTPGGMVTLGGVGGGAGPGLVIVDDLIPFEVRGATGALLFQGTLQDRVVRLDATGKLAFVQRIRDTQPSLNGLVTSIGREDFTGFPTDVDFSTTSVGTRAPSSASRSVDGALVDFDFTAEPIISGQESRYVHIVTDAVSFARIGSTEIALNDGLSVRLSTVAPVPEPMTLKMLALGVLSLIVFSWHRRA